MYNLYLDRPDVTNSWKKNLSTKERAIYEHGQVAAYTDLVEQLRDSKIKLLGKIHDLKEDDTDEYIANRDTKIQALASRAKILDIYDDFYSRKLDALLNDGKPKLLPSFD